ncbi:MAG: hypothetical protein HN817_02500 [Porticoccaceae bacterium]|jgi:hypothetical protein|nr:hypothetical protein [Porticoccaceae bacterium]MBT5577197.1 hypothetical protein [Porticoccaceae bacterium]MBT7374779.1 hypothetical protein [Porticoccaceae bacterium]
MKTVLFLLLMPLLALAQQPDADTSGQGTSPEPIESPEPINSPEPEESPEPTESPEPQDIDFKPSEEISEDFPVPLPADI